MLIEVLLLFFFIIFIFFQSLLMPSDFDLYDDIDGDSNHFSELYPSLEGVKEYVLDRVRILQRKSLRADFILPYNYHTNSFFFQKQPYSQIN